MEEQKLKAACILWRHVLCVAGIHKNKKEESCHVIYNHVESSEKCMATECRVVCGLCVVCCALARACWGSEKGNMLCV